MISFGKSKRPIEYNSQRRNGNGALGSDLNAVKETILAAIFVVHAISFTYFYVRRGRRAFNLMFCVGFIFLSSHYAYKGRQFFAGVESGSACFYYFRWAGLILCALATPLFLTHLFRKRRSKKTVQRES